MLAGFVATARGDLDGDGKPSTFQVHGKVIGDVLVIDPELDVEDPEE